MEDDYDEPSAATKAAIGAGVFCLSVAGTLLTVSFLKRMGPVEFVANATIGLRPVSSDGVLGTIIPFARRHEAT